LPENDCYISMKRYVIYIVLLCLYVAGHAQQNCYFTHYAADNGLSQNTIMSIIQDRRGIMWFASWDGLNKFDGYTFKIYKSDPVTGVGISHNRINSIDEDKYGFLWLMSYDDKVHRFDPSTETFLHVPDTGEGENINITSVKVLPNGTVWLLSDNDGAVRVLTDGVSHDISVVCYGKTSAFVPAHTVNGVFCDSLGDEWILGNNGLGLIKHGSNNTESFFAEKEKKQAHYQKFNTACETAGGLYFGSGKGRVWRYFRQDDRFELLQTPSASDIVALVAISPDELFIATATDGFFIYNTADKVFTHHSPKQYKGYFDIPVKSVYMDKSSNIWFSQETPGKVLHYNIYSKVLKQESLYTEPAGANRGLPAFHIHEDVNGYTWVHPYGGGFSYYDHNQNRLVPFFNDPTSNDWRFSNKIHSAYSDRQGNLWMCTHSKGIEKISFYSSPFMLKTLAEMSNHESLANEVRALYEDSDSNLWVGLKDGYIRMYDKNNVDRGFLTREGRIAKQGTPAEGVFYTITEDSEHNMWFGAKGEGLLCAVKRGDRYELTRYKHDPDDIYSLSDNNIYSIHQDKNGRIWVATFGQGINYIEKTGNGAVRFINCRNNLKNYPVNRCYRTRFITSDDYGRIWVGTTVGVLTFNADFDNPSNIVFEHYTHQEDDPASLSNSDVIWITVTKQKEIYFATFGGGLDKYIPATDNNPPHFKSYSKENGLSSNILLSILEDDSSNLWICSENGISQFSITGEDFENYDRKNLNLHTRFNEAAAVKRYNGKYLFGASDGILYFKPDSVGKNNYIPPIILTRLQIKGKNIIPGVDNVIDEIIDDVPELTLSHRENIFSLQYAALDLVNPENIKYACMLEGFEDNWQYVEDRRVATYTNLAKGKYVFKVKSTNSDGVWVENTRTLPITVLPSFWETPFAYCIYVFVILLVIFVTVYILFTIFRLKHKVSVEQQISDVKLRFFTDISHELRTPLTLINGPVEHILEKNDLPADIREQLSTVKRNSDRMLNLVNQILDFRKIQNKRMKLRISYIDAVARIRKTMQYFELLAKENNIDFVFETERESLMLWVDEDKFDKILFNLISNAFKYTKPGKMIRVFLNDEEKTCIVGVQDQGIGIAENKRDSIFIRFENIADKNVFDLNSTGIGLSLVKELADMHKATISLDSKIGEGSVFKVEFLKGRAHYDRNTEFLVSDFDAAAGTLSDSGERQDFGDSLDADDIPENDAADKKQLMLLIEDNAELRGFMRTLFEPTFSVIEAADGEEGLTKSLQLIPDVIISDIMMPGINGLELTKYLRANFITSHVPVVLLTAKSTLDDRLEGLEYGADDYITKPFSSKYLKAKIENLLARRRKLQESFHANLMDNTSDKAAEPADSAETVSPNDRKFLDKLLALMEKNMDNGDLMVEELARELAMSRSVFFKKLKALTGLAPIEFIREIRIKRAAELILENEFNLTEISEMVGINDSRYFSKCFKAIFKMTPTEYKEQNLHKK